MSWSFSVTEKNEDDALREFKNRLEESATHIPEFTRQKLAGAAAVLGANTQPGFQVTYSTFGHVNEDGSWNGGVNYIGNFKLPEEVPNVPSAGIDVEGERVHDGGSPSDEDMREHDPKPGSQEYDEYLADEAGRA